MDASSILHTVGTGFVLYVSGSVSFDIFHYILHVCWNSKNKFLKSIGYLHEVHHFYFNRRLVFNQKFSWENTFIELPVELLTQAVGIYAIAWLFNVSIWVAHFVMVFGVIRSSVVGVMNGMDSNHIAYRKYVPKDPNFGIVGPEFHALHHVYPDRYYSSFVPLFDWVCGTSYYLKNKRIVITGASGEFGKGMLEILKEENVASIDCLKFNVDYTYQDYSKVLPVLENADILILAHGSKVDHAMEANCDSFIKFYELFKKHRKESNKLVDSLPEVWAVGSEIEIHPAWGIKELQIYSDSKRAFARAAREFYDDPEVLYRHIVPSAFQSRMGPGIISGKTAARIAMFFIRRGFRYVPVTYTTLAFLNYFKFIWIVKKRECKKEE